MDRKNGKRVIGVDFDATLAHYDGWKGVEHLGDPVDNMIDEVKAAIAQGDEVFIFTARVYPQDTSFEAGLNATRSYLLIAAWCEKHLGKLLPITSQKLPSFSEIWDDRGRQVIPNTGIFADDLMGAVPRA